MVTKTVVTTYDDITDQPNATQGWFAFFDGRQIVWCDVDLVREGWQGFQERFNRDFAKWLAAGRVHRVNRSDVPAFLSALAPPSIDQPPAESTRTELPPEGATRKALAKTVRKSVESKPAPVMTVDGKVAKKPGNTRAVRAARAKGLPPLSQRPINPATGKPFTDHMMRVYKRPGIATWYENNWRLLGLPEPTDAGPGRLPKTVESAYDRYKGLPVTVDTLHPDDMERLTVPKG